MASKLLAVYVNRDDAEKFIADNCIESGDRLPTDYTIVKRRNTGEYAVYYNFNEKHDNVNHPAHYTSGGIECIDGMVAAFGREYVMHYCLCNAFKYIWRCEHKGKRVEDIRKAVWYLNKWQSLAEEVVANDEYQKAVRYLSEWQELAEKKAMNDE